MSPNQQAANRYRQMEVDSRSPLDLVVMLYDGALRFIAQARAAHDRGDIAGRRDHLSRALAIVSELQSTLNLEEGGEVAKSLDALYSFVNWRLLDVTSKRDIGALDEAARILTVLRDAWMTLSSGAAAGQPVGQ